MPRHHPQSALEFVSGTLRLCIILLVCAPYSFVASAQYRFDNWATDSGLPQNSVAAILQTRDGYLWLATSYGIVRFDGVRFTVFHESSTEGLTSDRVTCLFEDSTGTLWIGTDGGGVVKFRDGVFRTYNERDGLPDSFVFSIQQGDGDSLLLRTRTGLVRMQGEQFSLYLVGRDVGTQQLAARPVYYRDRSGAIWFGDLIGLRRYKEGVWTNYDASNGLSYSDIISIYEDREGQLWFGTLGGNVNRLKDGTFTVFTAKDGLPGKAITSIYEDRSANLWFGTRGGLARFAEGRFSIYTASQGLSGNHIRSIYQDREGSLWVGTNNNGVNRLRKEVITIYSTRDGLKANNVYPIYEDHAKRIWVGAWGSGLSRYEGGRFTNYTKNDGLLSIYISALGEDDAGRLWIGVTDGGLQRLADGTLEDLTEELPQTRGVVTVIYRDRAGSMWLGTDSQGLIRYRDGTAIRYSKADGIVDGGIKSIREDRAGSLWIGTNEGLFNLTNGRFSSYTSRDGLAAGTVRALYEDSDGVLWIGTYGGGLSRLKDGKFTTYTTREGLFDNAVFQILEDDAGNFWMSCNLGIYRVSRRQLNDFAEGKIRRVTCVHYGKQDGLINSECNGGYQPAGIKATDGRLWFPTQGGVAVIDPKQIEPNPLPPPVAIEGCTIDGASASFPVRIEPGQRNLEIHYTGLSFIKPEYVSFKYRLEGLDEDWVDAGLRRAAYYPHLQPGEYTFKVIAANSDGVWNTAGAELRVIVIPHFWQTWWARALAVLGLVGFVLVVYEWRIVQLRRAKAAQEEFSRRLIESQELERQRIAAELHDSLGQSLLIIKNRAYLGTNKAKDESAALKQFGEITSTVSNAIQEVRQITHNLRPYQIDRLGLATAIQSVIDDASASSEIGFAAEIDPLDGLFSPESEISLYRILQEGVNNILKHSGGSEAHVAVRRETHALAITIQDNGTGFIPDAAGAAASSSGFGLAGIRERVRILGGKCVIDSMPGRGTTINIRVDLPAKGKEAGGG